MTLPGSIRTGTIALSEEPGVALARAGTPAASSADAPSDEPMKCLRIIGFRIRRNNGVIHRGGALQVGILSPFENPRLAMLRTVFWCFVTMLAIGLAAAVTSRPFIFPSLGPTAIMLFANPLDRFSAPRNVLLGHFIGATSGYVGLAATGLLGVPLSPEVGTHRVLAAAIALALTAGLMLLLDAEHPPAGATTLIVALGILPKIEDFLFLMAAVFALTLLAFVVNRTNGIRVPVWRDSARGRT